MSFESKVNGRVSEVLELGASPVAVQIPVFRGPISGIAASPAGGRLLVTNYGSDSVSVIDADSCRVVDAIGGLAEPFAIALTADRAYVSTASPAYDAIQVIDLATNTVIASHRVALSVSDLAVSGDGKHVYISRNGARGADVAILDVETGRMHVVDIARTAGTTTESVQASSDGGRLYVGVNGPRGGQVVVIDTGLNPDEPAGRARWRRKSGKPAKSSKLVAKTSAQAASPSVIATVEIGLPVRDVAIGPNGGLVYVASSGPEAAVLDVVDTRTNKIAGTRKIAEVTGLVTRLTLSADGDRAYLVSDDSVTVVCTLTQDVIDRVDVASQPSCVAESADGTSLYVADYSGAVTVAPVAVNAETRIEQAALESRRSVDLFVPDLLQYDAALV
ncbi:YncE family protein [Mycobacterium sp. TY815]|uniref:YncE family protein n=1 Tax=Mycobacterium sp. TY815 TaxID=3050581 RepID=UPI00274097B6|nr:YncE family protein [Mycobacterium sp. TY815]MDP7705697.1 YncE family protein [Mycobacterium sp. TY815]